MSVMVALVVPDGIVFGTDRNVSIDRTVGSRVYQGTAQRPKTLKWPNRELIVAYAGAADIDGVDTDSWLYLHAIGRHLVPTEPIGDIARAIASELTLVASRRGAANLQVDELVIHLGGFVGDGLQAVPEIWFIRNGLGLDPQTGLSLGAKPSFDCSEELQIPTRLGGLSPTQMRTELDRLAQAWTPFWFHQGYDLQTFNTLDRAIWLAFQSIVQNHPNVWKALPHPTSVTEWERFVKMAVRTYGAYFEAFYEPWEQYVGGGADVASVPWP